MLFIVVFSPVIMMSILIYVVYCLFQPSYNLDILLMGVDRGVAPKILKQENGETKMRKLIQTIKDLHVIILFVHHVLNSCFTQKKSLRISYKR